MGFIRDCFTGADSYAKRPARSRSRDDGIFIFGTVFVVGGITLIMTIIHPLLGAFVLVAGLILGMALSRCG